MDASTPFVSLAAALGTALAVAGVAIRVIFYSVVKRIETLEAGREALARELAGLRTESVERYAHRDDVRSSLDAIFKAIRRVEDKLDTKADKPGRGVHTMPRSDFTPLTPNP